MYSKLKPYSLMGVSSNSEMFLSEKDLTSTMEISFLVRPSLEFQEDQCQIAPFQDVDDNKPQQQQHEEEAKCKLLTMAPLELKLPCSGELFKVHENDDGEEDENNDGFKIKTPTSLDHKIPVMLKCPPAPRKPKSLPILSPKRKAFRRPRILLDLTKEIESLFPPALLADLGNKIKKVRQ